MGNDLPLLDLLLRYLDVPQEGHFIEQVLVYPYIKQHGSASAVLRQDDGPLGALDLLQKC